MLRSGGVNPRRSPRSFHRCSAHPTQESKYRRCRVGLWVHRTLSRNWIVERALGSSTPSLVGTAKAMETLLKLETGRAPWADGHDRRPRGRDFQKGPGPRLASCGDGYAAPGSSGGHRSLGGRPGKLVGVLAIGAGWAFRGHTFGEGAVEAGLGLRGWRGVFLLRLARTRGSRRWGALRGYDMGE